MRLIRCSPIAPNYHILIRSLMSWLARIALSILRFFYVCATAIISWKTRPTKPSTQTQKRIPSHLTLLLVAEDDNDAIVVQECLLESVQRATAWCRTTGVRELTVYDRRGALHGL
jgi:dehydrodolichyl diphosphate syntase complex subunit NUS1